MRKLLQKLLAPMIREVINEVVRERIKVAKVFGRTDIWDDSAKGCLFGSSGVPTPQILSKSPHTSYSTKKWSERESESNPRVIEVILPPCLDGYSVELSLYLKPQQLHPCDNNQHKHSKKGHKYGLTQEEKALCDGYNRSRTRKHSSDRL